MQRWITTFAAIALLFGPVIRPAQTPNERSMAFDFPSGHLIRMKLSAGEYVIQATNEDKVQVRLTSSEPRELNKTWVKFTTDHGVARLETKDARKVRVVIDVPTRSDLSIRLRAGELSVKGIEGHKDVSMTAGELTIDVGDPSAYGDVSASVRVGEVNARPFQVEKGGFWRGFKHSGFGRYGLRATLGVGEINFL